jgi:hypothetical protein
LLVRRSELETLRGARLRKGELGKGGTPQDAESQRKRYDRAI